MVLEAFCVAIDKHVAKCRRILLLPPPPGFVWCCRASTSCSNDRLLETLVAQVYSIKNVSNIPIPSAGSNVYDMIVEILTSYNTRMSFRMIDMRATSIRVLSLEILGLEKPSKQALVTTLQVCSQTCHARRRHSSRTATFGVLVCL